MTVDALLQAIKAGHGVGCVAELQSAVERGAASHDGTGEDSAHGAAATWRIRQWTTERAGADTAGFADTVSALEQEPADARLAVYHFRAPGKLFVVFAAEDRVLACIRVSTPHRAAPGPEDPP